MKRNELMVKIGLIVCSTILSLFFCEIIVRRYARTSALLPAGEIEGEKYPGMCKQVDKYTHHSPIPLCEDIRGLSERDKEDGIPLVSIKFNSRGMRGPEIGMKKSPRVLILGDSFIHADYIDQPTQVDCIIIAYRLEIRCLLIVKVSHADTHHLIKTEHPEMLRSYHLQPK